MTGAKDFPLICWVGMFWDRGDNFSKINERGTHRVGFSYCLKCRKIQKVKAKDCKNKKTKTNAFNKVCGM